MLNLYKSAQEREYQAFLPTAQIHGCEIKDDRKKGSKQSEDKSEMMFRNPKEYEKMTDEQREAETKKMLGFYKRFATVSQLTDDKKNRRAHHGD